MIRCRRTSIAAGRLEKGFSRNDDFAEEQCGRIEISHGTNLVRRGIIRTTQDVHDFSAYQAHSPILDSGDQHAKAAYSLHKMHNYANSLHKSHDIEIKT